MEFKLDPFEDYYELGETIGSGQFAIVRKCRHLLNDVIYAAKIIKKRRAKASRRGMPYDHILREVSTLHELRHCQSVVKLVDVFENKSDVIVVQEYVSGGELFDFLSESDHLSEELTIHFLRQILLGVERMHNVNIGHMDLKPENLMLMSRDCKDYGLQLKIIDFGLSREFSIGQETRELLGTPEFVAPEVIGYDELSLATDMWSIGVIAYILLSGCSPFLGNSKQETFANITSVRYNLEIPVFRDVSKDALQFIRSLLQRNPDKRAKVEDCLQHPWINSNEVNGYIQANLDTRKSPY